MAQTSRRAAFIPLATKREKREVTVLTLCGFKVRNEDNFTYFHEADLLFKSTEINSMMVHHHTDLREAHF